MSRCQVCGREYNTGDEAHQMIWHPDKKTVREEGTPPTPQRQTRFPRIGLSFRRGKHREELKVGAEREFVENIARGQAKEAKREEILKRIEEQRRIIGPAEGLRKMEERAEIAIIKNKLPRALIQERAYEIFRKRLEGKEEGYTWEEIDELLKREGKRPGTPDAEEFMKKWDWERAGKQLIEERRKTLEKKPGKEPSISPEGRTPAQPEEGRREEREPPTGIIKGKVTDKKTDQPLTEVAHIQIDSPYIAKPFSIPTNEDSTYQITVPTRTGAIEYSVITSAENYKKPRPKVVRVSPGETVDNVNFELEPDEEAMKKKRGEEEEKELGKTWWGRRKRYAKEKYEEKKESQSRWLENHAITLIISFLFFLLVRFWLYPSIAGKLKLPFIGAPLVQSWLFLWGIPLAISALFFYTIKNKDAWGSFKTFLPWLGLLILFWLILGIQWTNFDYWLGRLDYLRFVGIPQDTIDNFKDGIRSVLSFLQFKAVEPVKPEAKKIGGFEAIQLKFGSKYNDYLLPTLFARMDYTLPVTVTNPNKFDTKLVVEKFTITDVFLNNRSDNRILCGNTIKIDASGNTIITSSGSIELGNINPEDEKMATIEFKEKTTQKDGNPNVVSAVGDSIDCREVLKYKPTAPTNPMYPAKIKKSVPNDNECKENKNAQPPIENDQVCKAILNDFYKRYSISEIATSADVEARYIKSEGMCECTLNRYYNIMDNLCFMDNDKAKITLTSSYGFKVQGKGELILVKTEADRKLAPKPSITSSAGPLTVTTYFVSDVHVPEKTRTSIMFIQITNDGDGSAQINDIIIDYQKPPPKISGLTIEKCSPMPDKSKNVKIFISKDGTTISCPVKIIDATIVNSITGSYLTVPVIVDVDYTYSQTHSTTINVKKETIPEGVTDPDQIKELDANFKPLPYYCPNEKSETYGTTSALKIYDVK